MTEPNPTPEKPPAAVVARGRAHQYADKLFDAPKALDEAGGIARAARLAGWSPRARKRAEASQVAARDAPDRQLKAIRNAGRWGRQAVVRRGR